MTLDIQAYLQRIGLTSPPNPDLDGLKLLHRQHLYTVPFENLDIGTNRSIILDINLLEQKIVQNQRGGFCYELNGLFCELLRQLGFETKMIAAGVYGKFGTFSPEFDHMALLVTIEDDQWLADVGFGRNFLEPLAFKMDVEQTDPAGRFKISFDGASHYIFYMQNNEGQFIPQHRFTISSRQLSDFTEMCNFHQTSEESHFTRGRICSIATPDGRITLGKNKLIKTINNTEVTEIINDNNVISDILKSHFNINLKPD
ncbi:MAG: arylamine N-acetyltransferase [Proteobacteria bacterium]|nr:arylamine N-acetyltransferase [Pseudomonadota bacterium]